MERTGPIVFEKDEHNQPDTALEALAKLPPAFRNDRTITAGNAPELNSGAAAMVVAERGFRAATARPSPTRTLIESCKLSDVDPKAWLADVLARIADHPAQQIDALLPWNWKAAREREAAGQVA